MRYPIHPDELTLLTPARPTVRSRVDSACAALASHAFLAALAIAAAVQSRRPPRTVAATPPGRPRIGEAPKLLCEIAADIDRRHPLSATILRQIADDIDALLHPGTTDPDPARLGPDRAHPDCWTGVLGSAGGYVHTCHTPSGRTCIEPDCLLPAGTPWGPYWCPDHDVIRLNRVSVGLRAAFGQLERAGAA